MLKLKEAKQAWNKITILPNCSLYWFVYTKCLLLFGDREYLNTSPCICNGQLYSVYLVQGHQCNRSANLPRSSSTKFLTLSLSFLISSAPMWASWSCPYYCLYTVPVPELTITLRASANHTKQAWPKLKRFSHQRSSLLTFNFIRVCTVTVLKSHVREILIFFAQHFFSLTLQRIISYNPEANLNPLYVSVLL